MSTIASIVIGTFAVQLVIVITLWLSDRAALRRQRRKDREALERMAEVWGVTPLKDETNEELAERINREAKGLFDAFERLPSFKQ